MVLTDLVQMGDRFKNADGTAADFKRGRHVRHFVGSTYQHMLNHGWYLYVAPTINTATEKFNGFLIITNDGTYITHAVATKDAADLASDKHDQRLAMTVDAFQIRSAMITAGVLTASDAWAAGKNATTQAWWDHSPYINRLDNRFENMRTDIGLTPIQADGLFT